jgi:hypothetical protein
MTDNIYAKVKEVNYEELRDKFEELFINTAGLDQHGLADITNILNKAYMTVAYPVNAAANTLIKIAKEHGWDEKETIDLVKFNFDRVEEDDDD